MKFFLFTLVFLILSNIIIAQKNDKIVNCIIKQDTVSDRITYLIVDSMPEFPGGKDSLIVFINNNLNRPDDGIDFTGTIYVSFIVEADGSLTNIKIERGIYDGADKEALKLIKLMPKWKPGKCEGTAVPVICTIPVRFFLN